MGYVGPREAAPLLLEGLSRLEYRGYDSAGIAVLGTGDVFTVRKAVGKLETLRAALEGGLPTGTLGLGHTRWATHGRVSEANAHPQMDCGQRTVVVHNGIVENYLALKEALQARGHRFVSQTDTEVLPHLIEEALAQGTDLAEAVRRALAQARGALVVLVANQDHPDRLIAARSGNAGGLVVGFRDDESFVASDLPALVPLTRRVAFLASGEMAVLTPRGVGFTTITGVPVAKASMNVSQDIVAAAKGGYKHFMLKEIMEQPEVLTDALRGRVDLETPSLAMEEIEALGDRLDHIQRVLLTGCGTSYHAALVARHYIEGLTRLPVEVDVASELRYRNAALGPDVLVVSIGQSGETADTLAAMEEAARRGAPQVTICNVMGSQATRVADVTVLMRAGPEVGVAATKTFAASLLTLYLLALHLGSRRRALSAEALSERLRELAELPGLVGRLLERAPSLEALAGRFFRRRNFLYLGRGALHPIALEGA
ncbi:MAG: glutamine--fructose-6-phosphate transaminase (isomerizing), partial [Chloroflexi bacterium]|nr:glutamine--fructose-6-phosphate transaminase (isomerizing) [Chloroflexota bacterium]